MREGADEEAIWVRVDDYAGGDFFGADHGDCGEERGGGVRGLEGEVDVEAVLEEDERGVGVCWGEGGGDEGGEGGRDVRGGFGAEEEVVVGGEVFGGERGDGGTDWEELACV